jgi:cytosol aminopeptidase
VGSRRIAVEDLDWTEASAEGAVLAEFKFDSLRSNKAQIKEPIVTHLYEKEEGPSENPYQQATWNRGRIFAEAQNFARYLAESPSNLMTPTIFCKEITKMADGIPSIETIVRDRQWIASKQMGAFMAVAQGSEEPMMFLEIHYRGAESLADPVVLVGKGITFDSGGISIKTATGMTLMKGDMTGAAVVVASVLSAAKLQLPLNLIGLIPLCENMPSGKSIKPGDVVRSMMGKTIEIENTDAEGRLILADALAYGQEFRPKMILDIATLTGAIDTALGFHYTGVFTHDDGLWKELDKAGRERSDLFWRMPLHECYGESLKSQIADIANSSPSRSGSACSAAIFLKEFVEHPKWAHLDIAGVMHSPKNHHYYGKGMTGRPTRSILQFLVNQTISTG